MVSPVSNASQTQPVAQSQQPTAPKPAPAATEPTNTDSVTLSPAAQAVAAALKEFTETSTQTAQEAGHGDRQAQRLLAKETAAESISR
jgi:hypothetical protein